MSRRQSLQDFQEHLLRKLSEQRDQPENAALSLHVGGEYWMVRLENSGEIISVPAITPVPMTKRWFHGLTNVRGKLYGVTDLLDFLGQGVTPKDNRCRLMLLGTKFNNYGALMVSLAPSIGNIEQIAWQATTTQPWLIAEGQDAQSMTWRLFEPETLLQDVKFLDVYQQNVRHE